MQVNPCPIGGEFKGESPVKDEDRPAIWKWAKDNTDFKDYAETSKAINDHFFSGRAPQAWVDDLIGGRKTKPRFKKYDEAYDSLWRKNNDRQNMVRYAKELNKFAGTGLWPKIAKTGWNLARTAETIGHALVFPVSHAADLLFHPTEWGRYFDGVWDVYRGAYGPQYHRSRMAEMQRDPMYPIAMDSLLQAGPKSKAMGILGSGAPSKFAEKLQNIPGVRNVVGAAGRAWDMLGTIRFEMWKAAMKKKITPDMNAAQILDYGREYAEWANDATGAGKGKIASLGGDQLFGPALTQSKINRVSEIVKTPFDFANWRNLTPGQQAVAWKRLYGATQYLTTRLGFLGLNAGILAWAHSKQKINFFDVSKGDWGQFKGLGLEVGPPGIATELRALARVLSLTYWEYAPDSAKRKLAQSFGDNFLQKPRETGFQAIKSIGADYGAGKLNPAYDRAFEILGGKDWMGRPVPWNPNEGTPDKPRMKWMEYALGTVGPIPLQGPTKFVYDQLKVNGASSSEALQITKGLIVLGLGGTGMHVREEQDQPTTKSRGRVSTNPFRTQSVKQPRTLPR